MTIAARARRRSGQIARYAIVFAYPPSSLSPDLLSRHYKRAVRSLRAMTVPYDVAVIGAGAAGMMCAAVAGQRGLRVVLLDHAERLAEKIRDRKSTRLNSSR